ncbi:MAG: outer membrane receptor protein involved in Fe transport [Halioglobus sp.]
MHETVGPFHCAAGLQVREGTFSAIGEATESISSGLALFVAERAPAIEELFSNVGAADEEELIVHAATGSAEVGNLNLDTEVSSNIDISFRWSSEAGFGTDLRVQILQSDDLFGVCSQ